MDENSLKTSWVPWVIKDGRPRSVPGHQNTENLPHLPDGADDCGDDNDCFYYKCKKCICSVTSNILGITNREGKKFVYVPEVKYIKPNIDEGIFTLDPAYHGEVTEFVGRYLSRMENLTGVAFNGWSSKDAAKIFSNVDKTFMGTKHENLDYFEIDWLVFSGSNLFVIEVGQRELDKVCDVKGTEILIHRKLSQSAKNELIIRHLLEVTDFKPTDVYYLAVFPNIPFEDVQRKIRRVPEQKESLNKLVFPARFPCGVRFKFGVITSDVISEKSVYLYENDGNFCEPKQFESLLEPRVSENQKYAVSIVAASMLLTVKTEKTKKKQEKPLEEIHLKPISETCNPWDWSQKWPKREAKVAVNYPIKEIPRKKNRNLIKFPEDLILGPEQIKAINSKKKHTIILGEAGSGKTNVLLAVLYKYAGKHITGKKKLEKLKKVHFLIPESKTELRKKVQEFIDKHCRKKWAQLGSPDIIKSHSFCSENIYLIDEFYVTGVNYHEFPPWANVWLSHTNIDSDRSSHPIISPTTTSSERQVLYFTRLYRSPPLISKVCAKISRELDQRESGSKIFSRIPWAMSRYDRIGNTFENCLEIESFSEEKFFDELELPDGETLIVGWKLDRKSEQKLKLRKPDATFYFLRSSSLTVHDLNFTGSEFKNVVIVLGEITDPISKSSLILLYNALSRTTEKAYVFCHATIFDQVKSLLELSDKDLVFDKLREGDNLGKRLFGSTAEGLLPDLRDRVEAFKRACVIGKIILSNAIVDFNSELREIDPTIEVSMRKQAKIVLPEDVERKGSCEESKDGSLDEKGETNHLKKTGGEGGQTKRDPDYETQNRSESRTKNDGSLPGPSQIRTNTNGSPDNNNEMPCRVDKSIDSSSPEIPNDELIIPFDSEHKELFRLASFAFDAIGSNQDLTLSLVECSSSLHQFSNSFWSKLLDVETLLRIVEEFPGTAENMSHFTAMLPTIRMVFSKIPSEMKIPIIQQANSFAFAKSLKNECTTLINSLIESGTLDEMSREYLKNVVGEMCGWMRQVISSTKTIWVSRLAGNENQSQSNDEQTAVEIIGAVEFVDEEDALIEFLKERQIEVTDQQFQFILDRMIVTKGANVFGEWLQHLMKNQSIEFSSDLLLDEKKRNLLMHCAKSTQHFNKFIELVEGNDLSVLLYQEDENGHNCFTRACIYDNLEVVKILIEEFHYDWAFWVDSEGNTIINILSERSNIRILDYLFGGPVEKIYQGKNPAMESAKMSNRKGWSFLSQICWTGNYNLLKFFMKGKELSLLQKIFPFPDHGRHYMDCLLLALTSEEQNIRVSEKLISFMNDKIIEFDLELDHPSLTGTNGENILMASVNCLATMEFFLGLAEAQGLQTELLCQKDSRGNKCLRLACLYGSLHSVELLLRCDNFDWKSDQNCDGKTLLHELCERGQSEILDYLFINYRQDFLEVAKVLDSKKKSCLYYACSTGRSVACVALLIEILDTILPLSYYLSHFIECLLAAKESGSSEDKEEILELLVKCFNEKMLTNFEELDDVFRYYRNMSADADLDYN